MEENNEKNLLLFKSIVVGIAYCFIGICALFFILVSKVNAATTMYTYNDNLQVLTQCNNTTECNNMTLNGATSGAYEFKENVSLVNNTTTTINITYRTKYGLRNYIVNETNPYVYLTNGVGSVDITNSCTIDGTRSQRTDNFGITFVDYNWTISCVINITTTDSNQIGVARAIKLTEESGTKYFTMSLFEDNVSLTSTPNGSDVADAINSGNANIINNQNNNTNNIISNNNSNADRIIDSNTTSAQSVINADNYNTDRTIEAIENQNKKCENYNYTNKPIAIENKRITVGGDLVSDNNFYVSDYIPLNAKSYTLATNYNPGNTYYCLYGEDKSIIQCNLMPNRSATTITGQVGYYIRYSMMKNYLTSFTGEYCYNIQDKQAQTQQEQFDYMKDSNIDTSSMSGFDVDFDYGGITNVITAPLQAINSLLNNTCSNLVIPLPFVNNKNITLPCLTPIYQQHFNPILVLYQTIITGIVAYWICLNIFHMVHGFSDPTEDKIEVVDL